MIGADKGFPNQQEINQGPKWANSPTAAQTQDFVYQQSALAPTVIAIQSPTEQ